jgi:tRNA threonylcarbamoyladenosine biosynthesis protein TsaB
MPAAVNAALQLAIDTSSQNTSLYIVRGNEPIGSLAVRMSERRSERLWTQIDFLLEETGLRIGDIDLFSVCTGPGGFTGIRVGIAAAKGLAMATRRRLIGVTSLEAVAAASTSAPAVLAMTRAHQGEVFSQLFRSEPGTSLVALDSPVVSSPDAALQRAADIDQLIIIGDGASDSADLIGTFSNRAPRQWILKPSPWMLAPLIAQVAQARYSGTDGASPGDVTACYVRPAQAETKLALGLVGPGLQP